MVRINHEMAGMILGTAKERRAYEIAEQEAYKQKQIMEQGEHQVDLSKEYMKDNKELMEYCQADVEATQRMYEELKADPRYNVPKEPPKADEELVEDTIISTEIYRRARITVLKSKIGSQAKEIILNAQRKQVAYGLDKYPEPLNANTWSIIETIDHIIDESIDRLHYLIMLHIKLEQTLAGLECNDALEVGNINDQILVIVRMIDKSIDELDFLVMLQKKLDRESEGEPILIPPGVSLIAGADFDGDKLTIKDFPVKHNIGVDKFNHFSPDEIDNMLTGKDFLAAKTSEGPVEHMQRIVKENNKHE